MATLRPKAGLVSTLRATSVAGVNESGLAEKLYQSHKAATDEQWTMFLARELKLYTAMPAATATPTWPRVASGSPWLLGWFGVLRLGRSVHGLGGAKFVNYSKSRPGKCAKEEAHDRPPNEKTQGETGPLSQAARRPILRNLDYDARGDHGGRYRSQRDPHTTARSRASCLISHRRHPPDRSCSRKIQLSAKSRAGLG